MWAYCMYDVPTYVPLCMHVLRTKGRGHLPMYVPTYRSVKQYVGKAHIKLVIFGEIKVVNFGKLVNLEPPLFYSLVALFFLSTFVNICRLRSG